MTDDPLFKILLVFVFSVQHHLQHFVNRFLVSVSALLQTFSKLLSPTLTDVMYSFSCDSSHSLLVPFSPPYLLLWQWISYLFVSLTLKRLTLGDASLKCDFFFDSIRFSMLYSFFKEVVCDIRKTFQNWHVIYKVTVYLKPSL